MLSQNWKSFFTSIQDWSKNKDKYTGMPSLPQYKPKTTGRFNIYFTNQNCSILDNCIKFPKCFGGYKLPTKVKNGLQQVRIVPKNQVYIIEIVYSIKCVEERLDNGKYISIDIGLDNFATIVSNTGMKPVIISGKGLKSENKYYNKLKAHYQSVSKQMNKVNNTNKLDKITLKRNNKVENLIHKASRRVIDIALENDISVIVIGNNKDWKRESEMGSNVNQSFVEIPHQRFIEMVEYKAQNNGIKVILTEESYTSGTSFIDNEMPTTENYNKSRRIKRGLFKSNKGTLINADVNAAYQILKKVFPNVYTDGIEGIGLCPVRVVI